MNFRQLNSLEACTICLPQVEHKTVSNWPKINIWSDPLSRFQSRLAITTKEIHFPGAQVYSFSSVLQFYNKISKQYSLPNKIKVVFEERSKMQILNRIKQPKKHRTDEKTMGVAVKTKMFPMNRKFLGRAFPHPWEFIWPVWIMGKILVVKFSDSEKIADVWPH